MTHCPHCSHALEPDALEPDAPACPHCGTPSLRVWPPPPEGSGPTDPAPVRLWHVREQINNGAATGCGLGFVAQVGGVFLLSLPFVSRHLSGGFVQSALLHGLPLLAIVLLYFLLRPMRPWWARGVGYSLLAAVVLLLGALAMCRV